MEQLKSIISIKEEIAGLEARLEKLLGGTPAVVKAKAPAAPKKARRKMSAEGRARIIAAQKARWAKIKGVKEVKAQKPAKAKRTISPEHRAKLAAMMKARWAAKKKKA